jgi:hypothetical protein
MMKTPMSHIQEVEIPEGKELLEDVCLLEFKPGDLCEEDGKKPYLKGRLGLTDKATANKRRYPRKVMVREIARLAEDMKGHKVYGELGHPLEGKTDFTRVSHFVTEAEVTEDGEILGIIEFIPGTTNGDQALAIARAGGKLGVSSRGFGTVIPDGKGEDVVQEDYKLVTWDIVADTANAGAHPDFVVEHKEKPNMDITKFKAETPEVVEALQAEDRETIESEARTHAREALREEFEERLREEAKTIREEAVEKARDALLEDPEVAGSATAIDRIKEVVAPFILKEDENVEMTKLRKQIGDLEQRIAEQDESLSEAREKVEELSGIAKELGYHLFLERELGDNDRAEQVIGMLGDVTEFDTLDSLKERVAEISEALSEDDRVVSEYEDRIAALEKENSKVVEERDRALSIGKQFGVRAYIERKITDNPRSSSLREYLDEAGPENKDDVDRMVEAFNAANPLSEEYNHIRKGLRMEDEDERQREVVVEGRDVLGVPMTELVELSNGGATSAQQ